MSPLAIIMNIYSSSNSDKPTTQTTQTTQTKAQTSTVIITCKCHISGGNGKKTHQKTIDIIKKLLMDDKILGRRME